MARDVATDTLKDALAARVDDHVEIAIEAQDGTTLKLRAKPEQLDAPVDDLEAILDADDSEAA